MDTKKRIRVIRPMRNDGLNGNTVKLSDLPVKVHISIGLLVSICLGGLGINLFPQRTTGLRY
ncbi:hypothetical protein [Hungatella sp.]|uniref:hypothetical protein n=1 Tax=Hungatella sp. TaxID=2613924 RepID=UPI003993C946